MKFRIYWRARALVVSVYNVFVFLAAVIWAGVPVRLWPQIWRKLKEEHHKQIERMLFALRMEDMQKIVDANEKIIKELKDGD